MTAQKAQTHICKTHSQADDSSIDCDNDEKDGDFIPEGVTGKYISNLYQYICVNMPYICMEYLQRQ